MNLLKLPKVQLSQNNTFQGGIVDTTLGYKGGGLRVAHKRVRSIWMTPWSALNEPYGCSRWMLARENISMNTVVTRGAPGPLRSTTATVSRMKPGEKKGRQLILFPRKKNAVIGPHIILEFQLLIRLKILNIPFGIIIVLPKIDTFYRVNKTEEGLQESRMGGCSRCFCMYESAGQRDGRGTGREPF